MIINKNDKDNDNDNYNDFDFNNDNDNDICRSHSTTIPLFMYWALTAFVYICRGTCRLK